MHYNINMYEKNIFTKVVQISRDSKYRATETKLQL